MAIEYRNLLAVEYKPLESSSVSSLGTLVPTYNSNNASLSGTVQFVYALLFSFIVVAAFYRYMLAGVKRLQASEPAIRSSNEIFKQTTLGLLGVFSLFLILSLVNKDMLKGDVGLACFKSGTCSSSGSNTNTTTGSNSGSNTGTNNTQTSSNNTQSSSSGSHSYQERVASHQAVVARLAPSGIHTNHGDAPCTEAQFGQTTPSCTSLSYLSEETIQMLLRINTNCHCTLVITGGTEPGHAVGGAHGEGKRGVDLQINDGLKQYIINNARQNYGDSGNCYGSYLGDTWSTFTFCDEKPRGNSTWAPHFHVS